MTRRTGPLADEVAIAEARRKEKLAQAQWVADLVSVLSTPAGRRLYYRIVFEIAGAVRASFHNSGSVMAFQEGRRDVGLTLATEAQDNAPLLYIEMLSENMERDRQKALLEQDESKHGMESDE